MKDIKVLGTGCPKCKKLEEMTIQAAEELGIEYKVEKVSDIKDIMSYGVMMTPALVVDGVVKSKGKVPMVSELKTLLS